MAYIIVKYASHHFPEGKAPLSRSVYDSFVAKECGVTKQTYDTERDAQSDLNRMHEINPTVGYGIVEVED